MSTSSRQQQQPECKRGKFALSFAANGVVNIVRQIVGKFAPRKQSAASEPPPAKHAGKDSSAIKAAGSANYPPDASAGSAKLINATQGAGIPFQDEPKTLPQFRAQFGQVEGAVYFTDGLNFTDACLLKIDQQNQSLKRLCDERADLEAFNKQLVAELGPRFDEESKES